MCPVYTVTIHGTGTVEYEGYEWVKFIGRHQGSIPLDNVRTLVECFFDADFFSPEEPQLHATTTGDPGVTFTYTCGDFSTTVVDRTGRFGRLRECIDQLSNTEMWTGTEERHGEQQRLLDRMKIARPDLFKHQY